MMSKFFSRPGSTTMVGGLIHPGWWFVSHPSICIITKTEGLKLERERFKLPRCHVHVFHSVPMRAASHCPPVCEPTNSRIDRIRSACLRNCFPARTKNTTIFTLSYIRHPTFNTDCSSGFSSRA